MLLRPTALALLVLLLGTSSTFSGSRSTAQLEPVGSDIRQPLRVNYAASAASACTTGSVTQLFWYIEQWVTGNELYKAYIDPAVGCPNPYPFTINEINMPMHFRKATTMIVSVDVEDVDASNPSCKVPGVMRALSSDYQLTIPASGGYDIWIPLDTPLVVNGPFYAGFFIGTALDTAVNAAIYTDTTRILCRSWNIWDTAVGFVDLANNSFYNFPGRLAMEVNGIAGGSPSQPAPLISLLSPAGGSQIFGATTVWAAETSGSTIIDYVTFEYANGGAYTEFARDYDGDSPLRDGVNAAAPGYGFSANWDISGLPEGTYTIRATVYDSLGRTASATASAYLEPTPPTPRITSPVNGGDICPPQGILMNCADANMQYIQVYRNNATMTYSAGLVALAEHSLGDANGVPGDGNYAAAGEFGDYYCGPAAGAVLAKLWYDRGYTNIMKSGTTLLSITNVAETLATLFSTRALHGTRDEALFAGLKTYAANRGNEFNFDFQRVPSYWSLRTWIEDERRGVILGLSGTPGLYVAVNGFSGWIQPDSSLTVSISDPISGTIHDALCRYQLGSWKLQIGSEWHPVDVMISMTAKTLAISRQLVNTDYSGEDGWGVNLPATGMVENNLYFLRATGRDSSGFSGSTAVLTRFSCAGTYVAGDYNSDGSTDLADLFVLIDFIGGTGYAPDGGARRADANCDNYVNVADIVYYMNYLFGIAATPCR
ncbi:hypothetical protein C3F09_10660 [candidate division GN15 bacterium]|uniref:Dockerin domain-containing protein n=1 Tax=candidate division GN15 bacterium TaxID=2072418 RepID=A0A855X401_9BACT|nr:MAG: hypothetical protein C3F09_10660 [candidate division GN15 bacterium]